MALTPLAIPMLAGPGAISTVIVLSGQAHGLLENGVVYGSIVLTGIVSFFALRVGEPLLGRLGKTGIRVVTRVMGLILAAVAAQFVLSGTFWMVDVAVAALSLVIALLIWWLLRPPASRVRRSA